MDAGLAEIAQSSGQLGFGPEPLGVVHRRERRIVGPDPGFSGCQPHRKLDTAHGCCIGTVDPQRLEQIAEPELKPLDSRIGGSDFGGTAQAARRFDVGQNTDWALQAAFGFQPGKTLRSRSDLLRALDAGQVD